MRGGVVAARLEFAEELRPRRIQLKEVVMLRLGQLRRQFLAGFDRLFEDWNDPARQCLSGIFASPEELIEFTPAHIRIEVGSRDDGEKDGGVVERFGDFRPPLIARTT